MVLCDGRWVHGFVWCVVSHDFPLPPLTQPRNVRFPQHNQDAEEVPETDPLSDVVGGIVTCNSGPSSAVSSIELSSRDAYVLSPAEDEDILTDLHGLSESPLGEYLAIVERSPGGGVLLHRKLSSPSRKRSQAESRRLFEERQMRAELNREMRQQEMTEKLKVQNTNSACATCLARVCPCARVRACGWVGRWVRAPVLLLLPTT